MAIIHKTTLTPTKLELLTAWLPAQPWYADRGRAPELARAGGFRLDDPMGEVGIEFMVVTDGSDDSAASYLVPMTYRASALEGTDGALVGTTEHGVLGRRWVYDGAYDPVLVAQLVALIQGAAEPQAQSESHTPDPTVTTGPPAVAVAGAPVTESAVVASTAAGTELQLTGGLTVWINRILRAGEEHDGPGVSATWKLPDGTVSRGVFATARHNPAAGPPPSRS